MTMTYTCSGADLTSAHRTLGEVATEMRRRADACADAGQTEWAGPDLHLTVDELPRLAADPECRDLLAQVLKFGSKLGVTGVARGGDGTIATTGGSSLIRDLLAAGFVLRHESVLASV